MSRTIPPSVARSILEDVSLQTGIAYYDIMSRSRRAEFVRARRKIYVRLRAVGASYSEIGRLMRRDHTTVMHALGALS